MIHGHDAVELAVACPDEERVAGPGTGDVHAFRPRLFYRWLNDPQLLIAEQATIDLLSEKEPSKRFTTVQHIGGLAVFLCSDAASNTTGIAMPMDGAWTAH